MSDADPLGQTLHFLRMLADDPTTPDAADDEVRYEHLSDLYASVRYGGGGARTSLVCGAVKFDHPAAQHLIDLLPTIVHARPNGAPQTEWLQSTLNFMAAEARELRPGGETIVTRLADILVIQALRTWLDGDPAARSGWLGALRDRQIGRAIAAIHREPGTDWTVASLAEEVGMSRSAFASRFTDLVGESAMHYLTRWRMHIADASLRSENHSVAEIARRLGYRSEAAFRRAFKRVRGVPPGLVT